MTENILPKPGSGSMVYESIEKMLICLLGETEKICKNCNDCDACSFLTQAVFTIGYKQHPGIRIHNA